MALSIFLFYHQGPCQLSGPLNRVKVTKINKGKASRLETVTLCFFFQTSETLAFFAWISKSKSVRRDKIWSYLRSWRLWAVVFFFNDPRGILSSPTCGSQQLCSTLHTCRDYKKESHHFSFVHTQDLSGAGPTQITYIWPGNEYPN